MAEGRLICMDKGRGSDGSGIMVKSPKQGIFVIVSLFGS